MKLDNVNRWLSLAANLGIVLGIALLAIEIRQNNALLIAQARMFGEENRMRDEILILENPELRSVIVRKNQEVETTAEEDLLFRVFQSTVINGWQATWLEHQAGLISVEGYISRWRDLFWYQQYSDRWHDTKHRYRPEFVEWMNEYVVSDPPADL